MPSPVVKQQSSENLTFPKALEYVISGNRISKKEWDDKDTYVVKADGWLCIHKSGEPEETLHALMINEGDLLGEDWYLLI